MTPLRIVGVDPGLSCAGVARLEDALAVPIRPRRSDVAYERHWRVATEVLSFALSSGADLAVLEDYAPHAKGINSTLVAGEVGGLIRTLFTVRHVPFVVVRPNVLKLYATGRGNADKDAMVDAARARLEVDLSGRKVDDLADAYWLADLGRWLYRLPATGPAKPDRIDPGAFASWPMPDDLRAQRIERAAIGRATLDTLPARTV